MAQDLTVNIKTTSDVPQAMDKAKTAAVSFDKQVSDIGRKFSTSFKDIFLGFAAPMIILQSAIGFISGAIAKAKQDAKDGIDLIAKGETVLATSDEAKMARFLKQRKQDEEDKEKVRRGRQKMTEDFLENTDEGKAIMRDLRDKDPYGEVNRTIISSIKEYQDMALQAFLASPEGKKYEEIFAAEKAAGAPKPADFKAPEGFGNVIGVGPNPVMEAMNAQLEEAKKQTAALERIAAATPGALAPDFTKTATA
jgi:hypothetical protein